MQWIKKYIIMHNAHVVEKLAIRQEKISVDLVWCPLGIHITSSDTSSMCG